MISSSSSSSSSFFYFFSSVLMFIIAVHIVHVGIVIITIIHFAEINVGTSENNFLRVSFQAWGCTQFYFWIENFSLVVRVSHYVNIFYTCTAFPCTLQNLHFWKQVIYFYKTLSWNLYFFFKFVMIAVKMIMPKYHFSKMQKWVFLFTHTILKQIEILTMSQKIACHMSKS